MSSGLPRGGAADRPPDPRWTPTAVAPQVTVAALLDEMRGYVESRHVAKRRKPTSSRGVLSRAQAGIWPV